MEGELEPEVERVFSPGAEVETGSRVGVFDLTLNASASISLRLMNVRERTFSEHRSHHRNSCLR